MIEISLSQSMIKEEFPQKRSWQQGVTKISMSKLFWINLCSNGLISTLPLFSLM
jgi:hypothetical protein